MSGAPPNSTCKTLAVGCPGIEPVDATIAIVTGVGAARGTIVHLSGGSHASISVARSTR